MQHALFGNGQPGILKSLADKLEEVKTDNRRLAYLITLIMGLMLFAAGNGTVSLHSLLSLFR